MTDFAKEVRDAHAQIHTTRCAAWLAQTGYRPRHATNLFNDDKQTGQPEWRMEDVTSGQALRLPIRPGPLPNAALCPFHPVTEATLTEAKARWYHPTVDQRKAETA